MKKGATITRQLAMTNAVCCFHFDVALLSLLILQQSVADAFAHDAVPSLLCHCASTVASAVDIKPVDCSYYKRFNYIAVVAVTDCCTKVLSTPLLLLLAVCHHHRHFCQLIVAFFFWFAVAVMTLLST